MESQNQSSGGKFDPNIYNDNVLEQFSEFVSSFHYSYEALNREPPINLKPAERGIWLGKDKRKVFLGRFAHRNLQKRFEDATDPDERDSMTFNRMVECLKKVFRSNSNTTLSNFKFRKLSQGSKESFELFALRVKKEAENGNFSCDHEQCDVKKTMIRDQIIIGTSDDRIREKALSEQFSLDDLINTGKSMEAAARNAATLKDDPIVDINRTRGPGPYSKKGRQLKDKKEKSKYRRKDKEETSLCDFCLYENCHNPHRCPARNGKGECHACGKKGHYKGSSLCKSKKEKKKVAARKVDEVNSSESESDQISDSDSEDESFGVRRLLSSIPLVRKVAGRRFPKIKNKSNKYRIKVMIKERNVTAYVDTGADICVMSESKAKKLGIDLLPTKMKIRPYGCRPKRCIGEYLGTIRYGQQVVNTVIYILREEVETLLSGTVSEALGAISFNEESRVNKIDSTPESTSDLDKSNLLKKFPKLFSGLGKLNNYQVKNFDVDESVPPVKESARPIPFHLKSKFDAEIAKLETQGVIEEHQGPTSFISNLHLTPKDDGSTRVVLDMRNANKAIKSTNLPIPRPEHVSSKLAGYQIFSKLDFKSAFYQLELEEESRHLTVFHAGDRLMRFKRLIMGCSPSSGELNKALRPIFQGMEHTFVIQDDLIVAGKTKREHDETLQKVCKTIQDSGMTLNPEKCMIAKQEIPWWGMMVSAKGLSPDPKKVQAVKLMSPPKSKDEVMSFFCMIQSDGYGRDFIPNLAGKTKHIRELLRKDSKFIWSKQCQKEFDLIKSGFQKNIMMHHFDPKEDTQLEVDASQGGISAMLFQGQGANRKLVSVASRATTPVESRYPQLDLEALAVDYGLRRFRFYLVGGPTVQVLTDHKPLVSIFKNIRKGSSRTDKIKLRHQDLQYEVVWKKGKLNKADYLSRHAVPWEDVPSVEKDETGEFEKLIWFLQYSPYVESLSVSNIVKESESDPVLCQIRKALRKGYPPKLDKNNCQLKPYVKCWDQLTITAEGLLLKGDKIILPKSLKELAIKKAHQGSHPGITTMKRRLRSHFFFPDMSCRVEKFVKKCDLCTMFTSKTRNSVLKPHDLENLHAWEKLSVDLFGPMPDNKSILVAQDMVTRFPAAKILHKTDADNVIAALNEIYATYGTPSITRTDNGPPFNGEKMKTFMSRNSIIHEKNFPYHPNANPVEALMKPLGKAMKIAFREGRNKKQALENFLSSYRATPHSSTGISPGDMLFRHGYCKDFPQTSIVGDEEVKQARMKDQENREARDNRGNLSRMNLFPQVGDQVMTRNAKKGKKFDPTFGPQWMTVTEVEDGGLKCIDNEGREQRRHFDDVKLQNTDSDDVYEMQLIQPSQSAQLISSSQEEEELPPSQPSQDIQLLSPDYGEIENAYMPDSVPNANLSVNETPENNEQGAPRRSERVRKPNPKYTHHQ